MEEKQPYRIDIDCLRCYAVLAVILFHCGFPLFSGGFVGVDYFFVISGFVMMRSLCFTRMSDFYDLLIYYQKRVFRIYPALLMMLFLTLCFSAVLFGAVEFDYFGKQLFFAGFSVSNLLFADGLNYFSANSPILLHTWSLAVEMQFYLFFPFFVIAYQALYARGVLRARVFVLLVFGISVAWACFATSHSGAFYRFENRAFEFLIGACLAVFTFAIKPSECRKGALLVVGIILHLALLGCVLFFENDILHPGAMTLIPISVAAAYIYFYTVFSFPVSKITQGFSYIGRISYGVYIYHFPVIIFTALLFGRNPWVLLLASLLITLPVSIVSYHWFETSIRKLGYQKSWTVLVPAGLLIVATLLLSATGFVIAKSGGFPQRLEHLNPYAYQMAQEHAQPKEFYERGYNVHEDKDHGRVLFVGDSLIQNYIDPVSRILNVQREDVDSVTRGGCMLLEGVVFVDTFSDVSCNDLRSKLYRLEKTYDYVFISQSWFAYHDSVTNQNSDLRAEGGFYLQPFLKQSVDHFKTISEHVVVLGVHPRLLLEKDLSIGLLFDAQDYRDFKNGMSMALRYEDIELRKRKIENALYNQDVSVLHMSDLFCTQATGCRFTDDALSYFYDEEHLTRHGQDFVQDKIEMQIPR